MRRLVLVEGVPGSGKSTTAQFIEAAGRARGLEVRNVGEGDPEHPADLDQVALLEDADLRRLDADLPAHAGTVRAAAEPHAGYWLVRDRARPSWPSDLREWLAGRDAYDGAIDPDLHARAIVESWRRFAGTPTGPDLTVFEAVLLQNPICALVARFDRPASAVAAHVRQLAETVADLDPRLVYLDPGDPEPVLAGAAAERPAEWLDFVIRYHTGQGYGAAQGLDGFAGLVEFMRMRRNLELGLLHQLPLRSFVIDVSGRDRQSHAREIEALLDRHLGVGAAPTS